VVPLAFAWSAERPAKVKARNAIEWKRFMSERFLDFARNDKKDFGEDLRDTLTATETS
jgi:hypothetical protein